MQVGFTETGRTRDGAFAIAFASPLPFLEARAAVNRAREITPVLYANLIAPPAAANGRRSAEAVAPSGIGTNQLIVKYRDPALVNVARAGLPPGQARIDRLAGILGEAVSYRRAMSGDAYVFRLSRRMPPAQAAAAAARIALEPDVEYAEPDAIVQHALVPNDALYGSQWDLFEPIGGINAPTAWNTTTGTVGGVIADIDTGFLDHPDLAGRFVSNGYDFIADCAIDSDGSAPCTFSPLPYDPNNPPQPSTNGRDADAHDPGDWVTAAESNPCAPSGNCFLNPPPPPYYDWFLGCPVGNSSWHGTHTAGTIAAASNNAAGIAGINWVGKILPARVLGKCGGYTSDVADAIVWTSGGGVAGVPANLTPARVMNLSLQGSGLCGATFQNAINTALANNAVVVAAAGNSNADASGTFPANCNGVITVAATQRAGARASYSNFGSMVEIAAPGGDGPDFILSTLNSGTTTPDTTPAGYIYAGYEGTSMAAPHVTGVVSLMVGLNPALTPAQVAAKIQETARAFPTGTGRDCVSNLVSVGLGTQYCGAGILDAAAAIAATCPTCTNLARLLVPDGTSLQQTFTAFPETRWFALTVEPGKTYVIDAVDPSGDLSANAIGTLGVFAPDGISAPAEASVDCTAANGPRPPAVDVASDGIRCVLRTALPTAGMQQNKRPVYARVTRADPVLLGGGAQFRIRARESTIYGRWLTNGYDYHVEVENTTGDAMCVEVARYPAAGLTYAAGPGWSGAIASFTLTVPAFGAVKQVIANGSLVGADSEGALRISACGSPVNLIPGALHVSTFAFDTMQSRFIYFFTTTANEGKTRSTW